MFTQNESNTDKNIRLGVGVIALLLGLFAFSGLLQIILIVAGALGIFTGLTGFCMLYKLCRIKTNK